MMINSGGTINAELSNAAIHLDRSQMAYTLENKITATEFQYGRKERG